MSKFVLVQDPAPLAYAFYYKMQPAKRTYFVHALGLLTDSGLSAAEASSILHISDHFPFKLLTDDEQKVLKKPARM